MQSSRVTRRFYEAEMGRENVTTWEAVKQLKALGRERRVEERRLGKSYVHKDKRQTREVVLVAGIVGRCRC